MAVLLLSAAGAKPLDGAEVTGLVSTVFDPALKSQIIRVGSVGKRASAHNTSISVRCTSRLRFVVFQMCASGSDGTSIELHVRDDAGRATRYVFSATCAKPRIDRGPVTRVTLPLALPTSSWAHVAIDLDRLGRPSSAEHNLSKSAESDQPMLERVTLHPHCQLRRLFCMDRLPADEEGWPRKCAWITGPSLATVVLPAADPWAAATSMNGGAGPAHSGADLAPPRPPNSAGTARATSPQTKGLYVYSAAPRTPPVRASQDRQGSVSDDFCPPTPSQAQEFQKQFSVALTNGNAAEDGCRPISARLHPRSPIRNRGSGRVASAPPFPERAPAPSRPHTTTGTESQKSYRPRPPKKRVPPIPLKPEPVPTPLDSVAQPPADGADDNSESGSDEGVDDEELLNMDGFTVASPSFLANEGWLLNDSDSDVPRGGAEEDDSGDGFSGLNPAGSVEISTASEKNPLKLLRRPIHGADDGGTPTDVAQSVPDSATQLDGLEDTYVSDAHDSDSGDDSDGRHSPPVVAPLDERAPPTNSVGGTFGGGTDPDRDVDDPQLAYDDEMLSPQPRLSGELSLIYDAELNCWFDPVSHQYYVLSS